MQMDEYPVKVPTSIPRRARLALVSRVRNVPISGATGRLISLG
jgi:hypothetical protein